MSARIIIRILYITLAVLLLSDIALGCKKPVKGRQSALPEYTSFRDIPGVTDGEIRAIGELQKQKQLFVFGMSPGAEAYEEDGEIRGFTAMFCGWLTGLFDIPFRPALYEWGDLVAGLESGGIDFTGELTDTVERSETCFMAGPIADRTIKYIRTRDSAPLSAIAGLRPLRFLFLDGTITAGQVAALSPYEFETFHTDSYANVYDMLTSGKADAFFDESSMEAVFDSYEDVIAVNFFPIIHVPVSMATQNPELRPIISVMQKALESGATHYLAEMYKRGSTEYRKHKLLVRLSEQEKAYLDSHAVIPIVAEHYNYPISFYNVHEKQWQGIYFDVLNEVKALTGLSFELVNDQRTEWPDLLAKLETGEAFIISELIPSKERQGRFLLSDTAMLVDYYALLSRLDTPNFSIDEVMDVRVGLPRGSAYAEVFRNWFPGHTNTVEYVSTDESFRALDCGEVDVVMSSQRQLLALTNYTELSGFKANLVFDYSPESVFGFNKNEYLLYSVVNKALHLIDVKGISGQWVSKTFDYRAKIVRAQSPWLVGVSVLLLCILILLFVFFQRNRFEGIRLEKLVDKRTTELKKLQKNLETALKEAQEASTVKSKFLATMSHEIRTPMNVILGVTESQLLCEKQPPEVKGAFEKIYNSGHLLLHIINDILDLSKIEAGKLELIPVKYEVLSLINDVSNASIIQFGKKHIEFKVLADENIPLYLFGDELRIKQILNNMLSNAFKYTSTGEVSLSLCSEKIEDGKIKLIVRVRDTGQGMTAEQVSKLFDEYSRFNLEANRANAGTGLGMAITRNLVKLMDGQIFVESTPGEGTMLTVHIPQEIIGATLLGRETSEKLQKFHFTNATPERRSKITYEPMSYGKVLVVDDMRSNVDVAKLLLNPYGLQIDTAESGTEAINKIKSGEEYDIVFMDHMMPEMDGIEATKRLRELGYSRPIIALTANAVAGQKDNFLANGFDGYISKPIDIRQLNDTLNKLIRDKERLRQDEKGNPSAESAATIPPLSSFGAGTIVSISVPGLDTEKGLALYGGELETYLLVLQAFISNVFKVIEKLRNVSEESLANYAITVHGLKGMCASVGAEKAREAAYNLELKSKAKDLAGVLAGNEAFLDDVENLSSGIRDWLEKYNPKRPG